MSSSDFRQIAVRADHGKSERLFRAAVTAFCSLTRPSRREIAQLEDLTLPLYDSVSIEARRFVAAALSECANPPAALVRRLADEPVEIAAPLLLALERADRHRPDRADRPSRHRPRPRHRTPASAQPDYRPAGRRAAEVGEAGRLVADNRRTARRSETVINASQRLPTSTPERIAREARDLAPPPKRCATSFAR